MNPLNVVNPLDRPTATATPLKVAQQPVLSLSNFLLKASTPSSTVSPFSTPSIATPAIKATSNPVGSLIGLGVKALEPQIKSIGSLGQSISEAINQHSFAPLAAHYSDYSEKVNMFTGEPVNMDYADPEKQKKSLAFAIPKLTYSLIVGFTGPHGLPGRLPSKLVTEITLAKDVKTGLSIAERLGIHPDLREDFAKGAVKANTPEEAHALMEATAKLQKVHPINLEATPQESLSQTPTESPSSPTGPAVPKSISSSFAPRTTGAGSVPLQIEDSIKLLTETLKEAKPIRATQEKLYTAARSEKIAKVLDIRAKVGGEKGFYNELSQLKGELPKAHFDSLREKIPQAHVDNLFNAVAQTYKLGTFEKITAQHALAKIFGEFGGTVPTKGELELLNQVFPPELMKSLMKLQPFWRRFGAGVGQLLNIPRSLVSSFDLSAPLRQGLFLIGKPKIFAKAFFGMFKQFGSQRAFEAVMDGIQRRPTYQLMRDSKLAITTMDSSLTTREERFLSNWAEKIPLLGRGVKASGRAYTGFLNQLRADTFDSMALHMHNVGVDVYKDPRIAADLAKFINSASGRGSLGPAETAAPVLNAVLFSPRLAASRINLINPGYYIRLHPAVRIQAIKTMLSSGAILATVLTLSKMAGASINLNATNADFLKPKVGNTRYDVLGGLQQYARLAMQLVTGKIQSSTTGKTLTLGEGYKPITRLDIIERFFQGKENPIASFITDALQGQDVVGNKFNVEQETISRFIPLFMQDMNDAIKEWGPIPGVVAGSPGIFGVGVQTYDGKKKKGKSGANPLNK